MSAEADVTPLPLQFQATFWSNLFSVDDEPEVTIEMLQDDFTKLLNSPAKAFTLTETDGTANSYPI